MYKKDLPLMSDGFGINLQLDDSNNSSDGVFSSCSEFDFSQEVIEFREVTNQRWGKASKGLSRLTKLPGNVAGGNITLRRSVYVSRCFWLWFSSVQKGNWFEKRKTMTITLYQKNDAKSCFQFTEAWPTKYRIGEMKSNTAEIQVQQIEIAYERFERISV